MLKNLKPKSQLRPPKLIVYGTAGIGKSTLGVQMQDCLAADCEDGLDGMNVARYPVLNEQGEVIREVIQTVPEFIQMLSDVYKEDHDFKSLMVDSLSALERMIWRQVCAENGVPNIEKIDFGKGYKFALTYWMQIMQGLEAIRNRRNMTIMLIGHADVKKFEDPMGPSYERYRLKLHEQAAGPLIEWADAVLFADQKTFTTTIDAGFKKKVQKASGGDRVLFTKEDPRFIAKNRYGLPYEIPLDWNAFISALSTSQTANHNPTPIIEEVASVEITTPAEWQEKPASEGETALAV